MIKKVYAKFKSEGVRGLVRILYHNFIPRRLEYYQSCRELFQKGTGLEIGGPSSIFMDKGIIPVYSDAEHIDNINFSKDTVWEGEISEGNGFVFNNC